MLYGGLKMISYQDFIDQKLKSQLPPGIEVRKDELNPLLFDYQRLIVWIALNRGRFLIGAECGLGKTLMQLEWAKNVCSYLHKPVLIVAPLGVAKQTESEEAIKFNYRVNICRDKKDLKEGINITNYEMLEHFHNVDLAGVVLDESSILKNFTGATRNLLKEVFKNTPYKLCCSATPAPNEFMELLNQADFLDIMDTSKALASFFINDMKSGQWRLKGHATDAFWKWVCSWAIIMEKPSDIGFSDEKYILPKLIEHTHMIDVDITNMDDPSLGLFRDVELSATSYHKEKKLTAVDRVMETESIVSATDEQFIIWCETNYEADLLKEAIPDAVEVRGSHSPSYREAAIDDFKKGKIRVLISKPSIFGFGMNFQKCHRAIFCGLSYSYEDYYQALKRIHRFGQTHEVTIDIVLGTTEKHILDTVMEKAARQAEIKNQMKQSIKDIQLASLTLENKVFDTKVATIQLPKFIGGIA